MKNVQKPNEFSGSQQMPNDPPTNEVHENESNDDYDNELYYDNVHQKYNDNNDINSNDVFNDNNDSKNNYNNNNHVSNDLHYDINCIDKDYSKCKSNYIKILKV